MKDKLISTSIFSLALAIVMGSWIISNGLNTSDAQAIVDEENVQTRQEKLLLTKSELGDYLGITEEQVQMFVHEDVTKSVIPYVKIGDEFYFSVKAIDKWLLEKKVLKVGQQTNK